MRWYRCDLQLHTPEDSVNWLDAATRVGDPRTEADLGTEARAYLNRCHELELDCIGITDHNFSTHTDPRDWFLTHLVEQNQTVAEGVGRPPLVIFPGFELDIRYHVLCLFEPVRKGKDLKAIDEALTALGLPVHARRANGRFAQPQRGKACWSLREILNKVQDDFGGIVIAAHAFSNDGICNDPANIPDFVQNLDLYAIEVSELADGSKAQNVITGKDPNWRRGQRHPQPAAIRSSDGKSLDPSRSENTLGCRSSSILMSSPSIESLRQAFLDPESRIRLTAEPPPVTHARVESFTTAHTLFLSDQTIELSPHLNCIIGGRGSGKSMLFEGLRLCLRGEVSIAGPQDVAHRQVQRLRGTFTGATRLDAVVSRRGVSDRFVVDDTGAPARIDGREVEDPPTVFREIRALIFSQEEITELADRQDRLLDFVDRLAGDRLVAVRSRAAGIVDELKAARQARQAVERVESEMSGLRQRVEEIGRQLDARTNVQNELRAHRVAREAERYLGTLRSIVDRTRDSIGDLAANASTEPSQLPEGLEIFPEQAYLGRLVQSFRTAYAGLSSSLREVLVGFERDVEAAYAESPGLQKVEEAIRRASEAFLQACRAREVAPEEADLLREGEAEQRAATTELRLKDAALKDLRERHQDVNALMAELAQCWRAETRVRREVIAEVVGSDTMPRTDAGEPVVRVGIQYGSDHDAFLEAWGSIAPDRRTAAGRAWSAVGEALFDRFRAAETSGPDGHPGEPAADSSIPHTASPVQWLDVQLERPETLPSPIQEHAAAIARVRDDRTDDWFRLLVQRVPDSADMTLFRRDGSSAGAFSRKELSVGQKNTALLSLLLARGDGPVLIDQPEDQLDSEFLYSELVPMLRAAKRMRQLIVVTHNANIPVNADAELVYALRAEQGRGVVRAQGGLDRPEVTAAVLDVMEGSREAFERRRAKYHF